MDIEEKDEIVNIGEEEETYEAEIPEAIAQILDQNDNDPIILYNDAGEGVEFEQIANIKLMDSLYVLLKPADPMPGVPEGNCLCFEIAEYDTGLELEEVQSEIISKEVFKEYLRLRDGK